MTIVRDERHGRGGRRRVDDGDRARRAVVAAASTGFSSTSTTRRLPINAVMPPTATSDASRRVEVPVGIGEDQRDERDEREVGEDEPDRAQTHELFDSVSAAMNQR